MGPFRPQVSVESGGAQLNYCLLLDLDKNGKGQCVCNHLCNPQNTEHPYNITVQTVMLKCAQASQDT